MKGIIIQNQFQARSDLKYFIRKYSNIEIIKDYESLEEALKSLDESYLDLIFIDLNLVYTEGIYLNKIINKCHNAIRIIFIVPYREYAIDAFEIGAFDFIQRPYMEEKVIHVLRKLEKENNKNSPYMECNKIILNKDCSIVALNPIDIYYCKAIEKNTKVYTSEDVFIVQDKISNLYENLPKDKFFRSHKCYIVNVNKIKEVVFKNDNTYNIKLQNIDVNVPVSKNNIKNFKKLLHIK